MLLNNRLLTALCCIAAMLGMVGCDTPGKSEKPPEETGTKEEDAASAQTSLLLSMSYDEAASLSPKKLELPPFFKVAADEIDVVRRNQDGSPRSVRAKGKVFLQIDFREPGIALCQEAYFGDDEVILRGHPILKRGGSVVEGMSSSTVFYILGLRLRVIGQHRLTNAGEIMATLPDGKPGEWGRSWEGGPNPLLPPLSPASVPTDIRREMQKAAEAEAVLQRSRIEPVQPLRGDKPAEKPKPPVVPPEDIPKMKEPGIEPPKELPKEPTKGRGKPGERQIG